LNRDATTRRREEKETRKGERTVPRGIPGAYRQGEYPVASGRRPEGKMREGSSAPDLRRRSRVEERGRKSHRLVRHRLPQGRDPFSINRLLEHLRKGLYSLFEIGLVVLEESGFVVLDEAARRNETERRDATRSVSTPSFLPSFDATRREIESLTRKP